MVQGLYHHKYEASMGVSYVQGLGFSAFVGFREVQGSRWAWGACKPAANGPKGSRDLVSLGVSGLYRGFGFL